jgi:anti-sigma-K factor RskA
LIACGRSSADIATCVAGWQRDAAKFIGEEYRAAIPDAVKFYIGARLRSSPEAQQKYCKPLKAE